MTAAHREASVIDCPTCRQSAGTRCVNPVGAVRALPCVARTKAAEQFDALDAPWTTNQAPFDPSRAVRLDSGPSCPDPAEPRHPHEEKT